MPNSIDNLKEAFAGESQAYQKYRAFAPRAEQDGFPNVARLFRTAAEAERIHADGHLRALDGIGATADNLKAADRRRDPRVHRDVPADARAGGGRGPQGEADVRLRGEGRGRPRGAVPASARRRRGRARTWRAPASTSARSAATSSSASRPRPARSAVQRPAGSRRCRTRLRSSREASALRGRKAARYSNSVSILRLLDVVKDYVVRGPAGPRPRRRVARGGRRRVPRARRPQRLRQIHAAQPRRRDGLPLRRRGRARRHLDLRARRCRPDRAAAVEGRLRLPVVPTPPHALGRRERRAAAPARRPDARPASGARAPRVGGPRRDSPSACRTSSPGDRCSGWPSPAHWCTIRGCFSPTSRPATSTPRRAR